MSRPPGPVFLERGSYRRRRLTDAARLLPFLGLFLLLVPLLWPPAGDAPGAEAPVGSAGGMIYLFTVWGLLVAGAWALARALSRPSPPPAAGGRADPAGEPRP